MTVALIILEEEEKAQNKKLLSENFKVYTPSLSIEQLGAELS